jgi:hypothetical protein
MDSYIWFDRCGASHRDTQDFQSPQSTVNGGDCHANHAVRHHTSLQSS